jgi:chemotaxis protein MotB
MIDKKQPIIIKKVFHGGHGHHGGAWKVAFADFVTAMMAFFMLMWLMGSTTKEERAAISEYFDNPSMTAGASRTPTSSSVQGPGGASTSVIDLGGALEIPKEEQEKIKQQQEEQKEKERLDELMESLKKAIEKSQALQPFKDQLLLDITPEGLRIQIVDKENRPMFDSGSAALKSYTYDILHELSRFINEVPNRISISGHTDAMPFRRENYGNWELSADRANAARRVLADNGVPEEKIGRVVGLSSSTLFDKVNPNSPINRRIAIIVMNKRTEEAISKGEGLSETLIQEHSDLLHADIPLPEPSKPLIQLPAEKPEPSIPPQKKPDPKPAPAMNLPMEYL